MEQVNKQIGLQRRNWRWWVLVLLIVLLLAIYGSVHAYLWYTTLAPTPILPPSATLRGISNRDEGRHCAAVECWYTDVYETADSVEEVLNFYRQLGATCRLYETEISRGSFARVPKPYWDCGNIRLSSGSGSQAVAIVPDSDHLAASQSPKTVIMVEVRFDA